MRPVAPVRLIQLDTVPSFESLADRMGQGHPLAFGVCVP